jgi:CDP-glycerol glycerophosphotransferase (TagB/SpsB family)
MPRLDRLDSKSEKIVAIMPTWRRYLAGNIDISSGEWKNSEAIRNSEYLSFYESLLNDSRLLNTLDKNGYKMIFIPHPNMKAVCDFIDTPSGVSICESCDYSDIFAKANLVVTDYSSAVFDLAYLGKPVIYAQFDKDEFFSGTHTYKKGYFDYEENGFGEVTYTLDDTVCEIIKCIEGNCTLDEKYRARIDAFFAYRDKENSARTLEKIKQLGAKNDKRK